MICRQNGWGKSTFASFIRAMFYGMPGSANRIRVDESDRKKYKPWQGGEFGGSLVFEVNGREYRVERTFGSRESEDTFRLTDAVTHLESSDYTENLGKELFGLDREAYSRSTYLPQKKISDGGLNDSIGAKLGRIAEGEEDGSRYDKAMETMEALRKQYMPDRQKEEKGIIAQLNRELIETQKRISECRSKKESAKPWREKERKYAAEKEQLEKQRAECHEKIKKAAKYEVISERRKRYEELCAEEKRRMEQKQELEGCFPDGVPTNDTIESCKKMLNEANVLTGVIRSGHMNEEEQRMHVELRRRFGNVVPDVKEIHAKRERETALVDRSENLHNELASVSGSYFGVAKRRNILIPLLLLVLAGTVAVGYMFWQHLQAGDGTSGDVTNLLQYYRNRNLQDSYKLKFNILLAATAVLAIATLTLLIVTIVTVKRAKELKFRKKYFLGKIAAIEEEQEKDKAYLEPFGLKNHSLNEGFAILENMILQYEHLDNLSINAEKHEEQRHAMLLPTENLLRKNGIAYEDINEGFHELENRCEELVRANSEYEEAKKKREAYEQENGKDLQEENARIAKEAENTEALSAEEERLSAEIAALDEKYANARQTSGSFEATAESEPELCEREEFLKEQLDVKRREHRLVNETIQCLKKAKENFSSHYMRGLEENFKETLGQMNWDRLQEEDVTLGGIVLDANLNLQVNTYGTEKELAYLSTGLQDLISLCMRLSLVDTLFDAERPFLVLDDPFVNLDNDKLVRALELLKKKSETYQVLYFVCHESRRIEV